MKAIGARRAFLALDVLAFPIIGAVFAVGLAGMLPYGALQPSVGIVLSRYIATFVIAPAIGLLLLWSASRALSRCGHNVASLLLLAAPLVAFPAFVRAALA